MIKEIVEIKFGDTEVEGFDLDEVTAMLDQLCTDQELDGFISFSSSFQKFSRGSPVLPNYK